MARTIRIAALVLMAGWLISTTQVLFEVISVMMYGGSTAALVLLGAASRLPWLFAGLTLVMFCDRLTRWILPLPKSGCPRCGYHLIALMEPQCPECGLPLPYELLRPRTE